MDKTVNDRGSINQANQTYVASPRQGRIIIEMKMLLSNSEYLKLFMSFSIALGNLNALAALLGQLPGGYSSSQYGITGFALILSGFLGAFIAGMLLEKTKSYRPILKITWICAVAAWILFVLSCRSGVFPFFIGSSVLLGFSLLPVSKWLTSFVPCVWLKACCH